MFDLICRDCDDGRVFSSLQALRGHFRWCQKRKMHKDLGEYPNRHLRVGVEIPYELRALRDRLMVLPRSHCVYFLIKDKKVMYVGETQFLSTRMGEHKRGGRQWDCILYIAVPSHLDAAKIELHWIKNLNPPWNNQRANEEISKKVTELFFDIGMSKRQIAKDLELRYSLVMSIVAPREQMLLDEFKKV